MAHIINRRGFLTLTGAAAAAAALAACSGPGSGSSSGDGVEGDASTINFWYGVKRRRSEPAFSAASAILAMIVPDIRPAIGATPTALRPFLSFWTPT